MDGPKPLRQIALEKGTDKEGVHFYADRYEQHLAARRFDPVRLLEIGVGGYDDPRSGGESLRMWKDFFPLGEIVGFDIYDKSALAEDRIAILQGDQGDAAFLEQVGSRFGPFDVVIDDGSHRCADVITSFRVLFRHLKDDGLYVVEDLQTSYWETYGGSSGKGRHGTMMDLLKDLVDGLNHAEFDIPGYQVSDLDRSVESLTFYHNLAFVQKGHNDEPSNLLPPHPRPRRFYRLPRRARLGALLSFARRGVP